MFGGKKKKKKKKSGVKVVKAKINLPSSSSLTDGEGALLTPNTLMKESLTRRGLDTDPLSDGDDDTPRGRWSFARKKSWKGPRVNLNEAMERERTSIDGEVVDSDDLKGEKQTEGTPLLSDKASQVSEAAPEQWRSFFVICLTVLIGDTARGVMFPTLWLLNQSLGGDKIWQGYAVAAFSAGRVLMSPIFGRMSGTRGYKVSHLSPIHILPRLLPTPFVTNHPYSSPTSGHPHDIVDCSLNWKHALRDVFNARTCCQA